jgi:GT2 family glycosyltransferase
MTSADASRPAAVHGAVLPATVVVPSRNRSQLLIETVTSVLAGDAAPAELIVVDQSDEANVALEALAAERSDLRYVWPHEPGVSRARNLGIRMARTPLIALIDDDVSVRPDWLRSLVHAAEAAGPRALVSGRVLAEKPATADGFVPSTIDSEEHIVYSGRIGEDVLYTNNMMLHRTIVDEIGGFDERLGGGATFPTAEDNDFAHRLLEAGGAIHYAPEAVVVHRAWRTGRDYLPLRWSYGRGQGAFYAKHIDLRDRYMLWRFRHDAAQRGIRFVRHVFTDPRRSAGQLVHLAGMLSGFGQWLLTRRQP